MPEASKFLHMLPGQAATNARLVAHTARKLHSRRRILPAGITGRDG